MQAFDPIEDTLALHPIEAALARLMPTALSQSAQLDIEEMIDELVVFKTQPTAKRFFPLAMMRRIRNGGIAAAFCACSLPYSRADADIPRDYKLKQIPSDVEKASFGSLLKGDDGSTVDVIYFDKERKSIVLDKASGIELEISEVSEETLLATATATAF
jgi:hypothetical protein